MIKLEKIGCEYTEVYELPEEIKNLSKKEKKEKINEYFKQELQGKTVTYELPKESVNAEMNRRTRLHYPVKGKFETGKSYFVKLTIGASGEVFQLVSNARYHHSMPEKKPEQNSLHSSTREWHYFTKPIRCDGECYDVFIGVRETDRNEYKIYSVDLKEKSVGAKREVRHLRSEGEVHSNLSSDTTIARQEENVNSVKRDRGHNPCFKGGIDWVIEEDEPAKGGRSR